MRFHVIESIIFFFLGVILCGLFYMQIIKGPYYHQLSMHNRIRLAFSDAPRGRIRDRNGVVLADNQPTFNIGIVPGDIEDKKALFDYLGQLLHRDTDFLVRQFNRTRTSDFVPVILAEDVSGDIAVKVDEAKLLYPGLIVQQGFVRIYPFAEAGAHVLGLVGRMDEGQGVDMDPYGFTPLRIVGKTGIEKEYDSLLQGEPGGRQIEIDSRGKQVRLLGIKDPVAGSDLTLTIDQRIQQTAQGLLQGLKGSIVVMDLDYADVLSLVSSPSYDPEVFSDKNKRDHVTAYFSDPDSPMLNRAISGRYPPGSVFKILVALAALQNHLISPDTTFECPGYLMVGKRKFGCSHVHGTQDLKGALAHSCNVYFYHVGQLVGPALISAYAQAFGLTRTTDIDLPFEIKGKTVTKASLARGWFAGDTCNLSIGQGSTLATPVALTVLMGAIANEGLVFFPRLVNREITRRAFIHLHDEVWQRVKEGLKAVIDDPMGTGHDLKEIRAMDIYGKTGTAQSFRGKPNHAWFAGYAESPKRRIAFCVFLEYGGSSENAVRIAKNLLIKLQSLQII